MNKATTPPPKQGTSTATARAWSSGKASGVPNYYIEGSTNQLITARPRIVTGPRFDLSLRGEPDSNNPERNLAAAVLMQALIDSSGKVYPRDHEPGADQVTVAEARAFLTAPPPSPWAKSRQRYTGMLGLDDECFRAAAARKLKVD